MIGPFHSGEISIQEMTAERGLAERNSRMVSDQIPAPAVGFVNRQRHCVLGWCDASGAPWARVVAGDSGFVSVDDSRQALYVGFDEGVGNQALSGTGLKLHDHLGVLFIELSTRRRLRVNGRVSDLSNSQCTIAIDQAYPNCPKYIQRRTYEAVETALNPTPLLETGNDLSKELKQWITTADTCFVASSYPDGPVDVSHRGGHSGFIEIVEGDLRIPDYRGNSMFNTLGNLHLNPRAGLTFLDFEANLQLQITGDVRIDLNGDDPEGKTGGTSRWWHVATRQWTVATLNRALVWHFVDASPHNP